MQYDQKHTKEPMHSEMGLMRQNLIQRTVRTALLRILMTVCNFSTQYNTNIIAQMLSIGEEGAVTEALVC